MAKYETMLITSAALDEEATAALVGKFKTLIEANGTIDSIDEWGKRRLAYPINDEEEGVYTVINFTSEPSFPAELDRVYTVSYTHLDVYKRQVHNDLGFHTVHLQFYRSAADSPPGLFGFLWTSYQFF